MNSLDEMKKYIGSSAATKPAVCVMGAAAVLCFVMTHIAVRNDSDAFAVLLIGAVVLAGACLLTVYYGYLVNANMKRCFARLEQLGMLDDAATEFESQNVTRIAKDRVRISDKFIFGCRTGTVVSISDIVWAYERDRSAKQIHDSGSVVLFTKTMKSIPLSLEIFQDDQRYPEQILEAIKQKNPDALIGMNRENADLCEYIMNACKER